MQGKHRPMVEASAQGHVGLVKSLLEYKADINASDQVSCHYLRSCVDICMHNHDHIHIHMCNVYTCTTHVECT